MDENKFWLRIWQSIIAGVVAIGMTIGGCTAHGNYLTVKAVEKGADPIKMQCALSSAPSSINCALAAASIK